MGRAFAHEPYREIVEYCLARNGFKDIVCMSGVQRRRPICDTVKTVKHDSSYAHMCTIPADSVPVTVGVDCRTYGDGT
jgi:hypothetical protein